MKNGTDRSNRTDGTRNLVRSLTGNTAGSCMWNEEASSFHMQLPAVLPVSDRTRLRVPSVLLLLSVPFFIHNTGCCPRHPGAAQLWETIAAVGIPIPG